MTDKQIIIDGIDVHWCEHYTGNIGYLTDKNWTCRAKIQGTKCEDWSDCYFKRWQRKEQECEELKIYIESNEQQVKEVETLVMDNDRLINELDQLKAENKHLNDLLNQALKELEKTRETLTEIKEMLKEICMEECLFDWNKTSKKHCGDCDCRYGQILQKISEVKNDMENN